MPFISRLSKTFSSSSNPSPSNQSFRSTETSPYPIDRQSIERLDQLQKDVKITLERSTSNSSTPSQQQFYMIQEEITQNQKESLSLSRSHLQLLQKLQRHETNPIHRLFQQHNQKRIGQLKFTLLQQLTLAIELDQKRDMLQHRSMQLHQDPSFHETNTYEMKREQLIHTMLQIIPTTDCKQIQSEVSSTTSTLHVCSSIELQIMEFIQMHEQALHFLRRCLNVMLSSDYSVHEFILNVYPLALEANRLIGLTMMMIQPETKRRFPEYTQIILSSHLIKFPSLIKDLSRPKALEKVYKLPPIEVQDKLAHAERLVYQLHEVTARNLIELEEWKTHVHLQKKQAQLQERKLSCQLDSMVSCVLK